MSCLWDHLEETRTFTSNRYNFCISIMIMKFEMIICVIDTCWLDEMILNLIHKSKVLGLISLSRLC